MSSNNGLRWEAVRIIKDLSRLADTLDNSKAERLHVSCVNCDNWSGDDNPNPFHNEKCMRYKERPPAKIIAFGCPDWSNVEDDVPF